MRQGRWWLAWLFVLVAGFILIEGVALVDPLPGDTLSEWVWFLFSFPIFAVPFSILWFGGLVWLTVHFFKKAKW